MRIRLPNVMWYTGLIVAVMLMVYGIYSQATTVQSVPSHVVYTHWEKTDAAIAALRRQQEELIREMKSKANR